MVTSYDRSQLIERAVDNLKDKPIEEFLVVAPVCAVLLFDLHSALIESCRFCYRLIYETYARRPSAGRPMEMQSEFLLDLN